MYSPPPPYTQTTRRGKGRRERIEKKAGRSCLLRSQAQRGRKIIDRSTVDTPHWDTLRAFRLTFPTGKRENGRIPPPPPLSRTRPFSLPPSLHSLEREQRYQHPNIAPNLFLHHPQFSWPFVSSGQSERQTGGRRGFRHFPPSPQ